MHLTPHAQAVVLLTVAFDKSDGAGANPLSKGEWARLALWLKDHGLDPGTLLKGDLASLLAGWMDGSVSVARLQALLGRGAALGFALEKWQRAGLWLLTRSDPDYPERLKRRLRSDAPAVLFGGGNKRLLDRGGIAVVGSRDAGEDDLAFTEKLGKEAADQGYSIVSGGARGVDQRAMLGALASGGIAVGVLADSLLKSATSASYRKHLMAGDLALISPFHPEAGFNVGNAMARNRYIYCLADAAVVVNSTLDKGGTWNGALEDLKAGWVPLWVRRDGGRRSGNPELVRRGARWLGDDPSSLGALIDVSPAPAADQPRLDLPPPMPDAKAPSASEPEPAISEDGAPKSTVVAKEPMPESPAELAGGAEPDQAEMDPYGMFLVRLARDHGRHAADLHRDCAASCIEEDAGKCLAEERRRRRQDQEDVETRQIPVDAGRASAGVLVRRRRMSPHRRTEGS